MLSLLASLLWCTSVPLAHDCRPVEIAAPRGELRLAVANDARRREHGLMFVRSVPRGQGMIFAFPDGDQARSFWMKNTIAPLDMIFVAGDGTVNSVEAQVPATRRGTPDDRVATRQGSGTFVIELAAGDAAREGIAAGTKLTIPPLEAR